MLKKRIILRVKSVTFIAFSGGKGKIKDEM